MQYLSDYFVTQEQIKNGMMTIMIIMVVIGMMMMKINFLSGMMVIKNARHKKPQAYDIFQPPTVLCEIQ